MSRRIWLWGPAVALMGLIFWLSSQPVLPAPPSFLDDKRIHSITYGALTLLLGRALANGRWLGLTPRRVAMAVVIAVLYGVSDEYHQSFVPGRMPDIADVYADATGASSAGLLLWACGIIAARRTARRVDATR